MCLFVLLEIGHLCLSFPEVQCEVCRHMIAPNWSLPLNHTWGHQGKAGNVSSMEGLVWVVGSLEDLKFKDFSPMKAIWIIGSRYQSYYGILSYASPFHMNLLNMSSNHILPFFRSPMLFAPLFTLSRQYLKFSMFVICVSSEGIFSSSGISRYMTSHSYFSLFLRFQISSIQLVL